MVHKFIIPCSGKKLEVEVGFRNCCCPHSGNLSVVFILLVTGPPASAKRYVGLRYTFQRPLSSVSRTQRAHCVHTRGFSKCRDRMSSTPTDSVEDNLGVFFGDFFDSLTEKDGQNDFADVTEA